MIEIKRLAKSHFPAQWLAYAVEDFKRRSDPRDVDHWTPDDVFEILSRMRENLQDAGWVAYRDGEPVGFAAIVFGASMKIGTIDAQIVALYVDPKAHDLSIAPALIAAMKDHAKKNGARRLIGGTQRGAMRAFQRLGGILRAVIYEIPLGDEMTECLDAARA